MGAARRWAQIVAPGCRAIRDRNGRRPERILSACSYRETHAGPSRDFGRPCRLQTRDYDNSMRATLGERCLLTSAALCMAFAGAAAGQAQTAAPAQAAPSGGTGGAAPSAEQEAIEAAKRNPIAHPEPRSLYPEQRPPPRPEGAAPKQAPPPREPAPPAQAAPPPATGQAAQAPAAATVESDTRVVAPEAPPPPPEEDRPPAPALGYVWAPGYWYWYDDGYVWIPGAWLPPRHGYVYWGARWVLTPDGWVFVPGGWGARLGGSLVYPDYRYRYLHPYYRPYRPYRPFYRPYRRPYVRPREPYPNHRRDGSRYAPPPRYNRPRAVPRREGGNRTRSYGGGGRAPAGGTRGTRGPRTTVRPRR